MAIYIHIETSDDRNLEAVIKCVDGLNVKPFEKELLLERALGWVKLANRHHYPGPLPAKVRFEIDGERLLSIPPPLKTQTESTPCPPSNGQPSEVRS